VASQSDFDNILTSFLEIVSMEENIKNVSKLKKLKRMQNPRWRRKWFFTLKITK
jgi:hypothetical protein